MFSSTMLLELRVIEPLDIRTDVCNDRMIVSSKRRVSLFKLLLFEPSLFYINKATYSEASPVITTLRTLFIVNISTFISITTAHCFRFWVLLTVTKYLVTHCAKLLAITQHSMEKALTFTIYKTKELRIITVYHTFTCTGITNRNRLHQRCFKYIYYNFIKIIRQQKRLRKQFNHWIGSVRLGKKNLLTRRSPGQFGPQWTKHCVHEITLLI